MRAAPLFTAVLAAFADAYRSMKSRRPADVAVTVLLTFGIDPQRGNVYQHDLASHLGDWPASCVRSHTNCIVLHDDVYSDAFVAEQRSKYSPFVTFERIDGRPPADLEKLTTSDMRFFAFEALLKRRPEIEYAVLTDAHDVWFRSNPATYMRAVDGLTGGAHHVYGQEEYRPTLPFDGREEEHTANFTGLGLSVNTPLGRLVPYFHSCFHEDMPYKFKYSRMLNCAILGGHRSVLFDFLSQMRYWYQKVPLGARFLMCDMLVYMRVGLGDFHDRLVTGYPWHARFKSGGFHYNETAVIYHKNGALADLVRAEAALPHPAAAEAAADVGARAVPATAPAILEEGRSGPALVRLDGLVKELEERWSDVRVLETVPTAQDAASWRPKVVVVTEGLFLSVGDGKNPELFTTHYYNVVNILLPYLLAYVYEPLKAAGRTDVSVQLSKETKGINCVSKVYANAGAKLDAGTRMDASMYAATMTWRMLEENCHSGILLIEAMIPDLRFAFVEGLPRCVHFGHCYAGSARGDAETTLLVIPKAWPFGCVHAPADQADANLATLRRYFHHASEPADQVTLIVRGPEVPGDHHADYSYERPKSNVRNMMELVPIAQAVASANGLSFATATLEELTFPDQLALFRKTRVLIGTEGAGLANMVFLQDPLAEKQVLEINWPGGKVDEEQEFPTMSRRLGVNFTIQMTDESHNVHLDDFRKILEALL